MDIDIDWLRAQFPGLSIIRHLNRGGFKEVFSATHPTAGDVVLKIIHPSSEPEEVRREILATQQIHSPRIPQVIDVGVLASSIGNCIWIIEQRVMGTTIREVLNTSPLGRASLLTLAEHVLEVLEKSEAVRIVHRDIKPENIMVDQSGNYYVLDFGIARHLTLASLTPTAAWLGKGTPGYASSEQISNIKSEIDSRADLFSLGVTLYECATGINPYHVNARDPLDVCRRVVTQPFPRLNVAFDRTGQIRDLVASMTQMRRDQRIRRVTDARNWVRDIIQREGMA